MALSRNSHMPMRNMNPTHMNRLDHFGTKSVFLQQSLRRVQFESKE